MKRSDNISELAKAKAAAQGEMHNPPFDSKNPHFKSSFASLAAVRNAVIPVFAKHGISVSQELVEAEGKIGCITILTHQSGQWEEFGPFTLPATKPDAQGFGSAATYARRYSLMAVACVVGDEDDDGNAAAKTPPYVTPAMLNANIRPTADAWESMTEKQQSELMDIATVVKEYLDQGDIDSAAREISESGLEQEEKVALWTRFDSKQRTALTKALKGETRKSA